MTEAETIYESLVESTERELMISMLTDHELLCVSGMLIQNYEENSVSGEILGLCLVERSSRWAIELMKRRSSERNDGGEE
jgi:hypothetical protein